MESGKGKRQKRTTDDRRQTTKRNTKIRVVVTLKKSVLDPQGQTVQHALESLGFKGIACVRMGKYIEVAFNGKSENPKQSAEKMCKKLLANPVIEQYEIL